MSGISERVISPIHGFSTPPRPDGLDRLGDSLRGATNHSIPLGAPEARPRTEGRVQAIRPADPPSSWMTALAMAVSLLAIWAGLCLS